MPTTAEQAVREYLISLREPESLIDQMEIERIQAQLGQEEDVLRRLELQEELRRAQSADATKYEDAFVTHAKEWASQQGVSADAFLSEGVDRNVLRRAGLLSNGGRKRGGGGQGSRRSRVSREDVEQAVLGHRKNQAFTIKSVQEKSGGSPATVRNVINDLVGQGAVQEQGPDPDHSGPGRAPTLYKKA